MKYPKTAQIYTALLIGTVLLPAIILTKYFGMFAPQKIVPFELIIEALLPVYFYLLYKNKTLRPDLKKTGLIIFLTFFAWTLLSSLFGVDLINSFFGNTRRYGGLIFQTHLVLFVVYLLTAFKYRPRLFNKIAKVSVLVVVLISLYGIFEWFGFIEVQYSMWADRAISTLGNPIFFASYLVIPFVLSLNLLVQEKKKWIYGISTSVILFGFYITRTRGVYMGLGLGIIVGLFLYFVLNKSAKTKKTIIVSLIAIIFLSSTFLALQKDIAIQMINKFGNSGQDRIRYWKIATEVIHDAPLFGVGYENYYRLAEKYYTVEFYEGEGEFVDKPHNQFLETFATSGIPGSVLYIALFVVLVKILLTSYRDKNISLAEVSIFSGGLVAYHIQNFFVFDTVSASILYSLFVAYLLSLEQSNKDEHQELKIYPNKIIIILSIAFPMLIFSGYHLQSLREFYSIEQSRNAKTPQESIKKMSISESNYFNFDEAARAAEYSDMMIRSVGVRMLNDELYNQILEKAEKSYNKALYRHSKRGEFYFQLGNVYMMHALATGIQISEQKIEYINKAIELMPGRIEPKITLVNILDINGQREEAIKKAQVILSEAPNSKKITWTIAILYLKDDQTDEAAKYALQALRQGVLPNSSIELMRFFDYYVDKNEIGKAIGFVQRAIEVEPNNNTLMPKLAAAYAANGQTEKAIETAREFIKKNPSEKEGGEAFISQLLNK